MAEPETELDQTAEAQQSHFAKSKRLIGHLSLMGFATALAARAVDPLIPPIATTLDTDVARVALLSTAFALPFALVQPILGPLADAVGKVRTMMACVLVIMLSSFLCATATSYWIILFGRIVGGMASGGIFPVGMAIVGDLVPVKERQVALGRWLAIVIAGNLLGAAFAGVIGDFAGWRAVFVAVGLACGLAFVNGLIHLRAAADVPRKPFSLRAIPSSYLAVLANPRAKFCFSAVFLEGIAVFGLFPYISVLLMQAGEPRAAIAGLVIAGFSIGGLIYSMTVAGFMRHLKQPQMMVTGAAMAAFGFLIVSFDPSWIIQFASLILVGVGFYLLHACIQVEATELLPSARGTAISLHSLFFFVGNATGPVVYGLTFTHLGSTVAVLLGGALILSVGIMCTRTLARP
ncbi:MAG: MFS transporter [Hyphomicrobiales bacterium]|nr:MAG: MFS transporter [Hyphomicrobiales bacterium]